MPSQGRRAEQIDIYVPQEEACGREKPGNGVLKSLVRAEFLHSKKRYGVRRITASLHSKGNDINHKTVHRIMKKFGLRF